jgi:hypothetical protein
MVTIENVKQVFNSGGLAYPYPRRGEISINGGKGQKATKEAVIFARMYLNELKGVKHD